MINFLKLIIRDAGSVAKGYYHEGVEHHYKSDPTDLVTKADLAVNDFLVEKIRAQFPEHGIISEELPDEINPGAEYTWVIDPIDGTRNFANHIAYWCTMVGVTKYGRPYLGAIYDAMNDELFFAEAGKGAFLNNKPIAARNSSDPLTCFMVYSLGRFNTDSPYDDNENYPRFYKFFENITKQHGLWAMNYGSALEVCHVAAGRLDAVVLSNILYHDVLASYVIATEAGAKFTDCHGADWQRGVKHIVVASPKLHKKLLRLFEI